MTYPILENGLPIGTLRLERQGLYCRFTARCAFRPGVQRLWLFSETGSFCLGVLMPEGDGLSLSRLLSRAALRRLPPSPRFAALGPRSSPARTQAPGFAIRYLFGSRFLVVRG